MGSATTTTPLPLLNYSQQLTTLLGMTGTETALNGDNQGLRSHMNSIVQEREQTRTVKPDPPGMSFVCPQELDRMNFFSNGPAPAGMAFMNDFIPDQFLTGDPLPFFGQP
jgi:hypothetical protein